MAAIVKARMTPSWTQLHLLAPLQTKCRNCGPSVGLEDCYSDGRVSQTFCHRQNDSRYSNISTTLAFSFFFSKRKLFSTILIMPKVPRIQANGFLRLSTDWNVMNPASSPLEVVRSSLKRPLFTKPGLLNKDGCEEDD